MDNLNIGFHNVLNGNGIEISIIGMSVVFVALALISFFISTLPMVLDKIALIYPSKEDSPTTIDNSAGTENVVLAAIGSLLYAEKRKNFQSS